MREAFLVGKLGVIKGPLAVDIGVPLVIEYTL